MMNRKNLAVQLTLVPGIVATATPKVRRVATVTEAVSCNDDSSGSRHGVSVTSRGLGDIVRVIGGEG